MIEAHTVDAWTRAADRHSAAFGRALMLGGFAAPLFLWLAGIGVALSAARLARTGDTRASRRRHDLPPRSGNFHPRLSLPPAGVHRQSGQLSGHDVPRRHPERHGTGDRRGWPRLGRSVRAPGRWSLWYAAVAAAIALLTPIVRTAAIVDVLPLWFQWYVRPAGDLTTFTLFPWAGFVFAGAACGVLLATTDNRRGGTPCAVRVRCGRPCPRRAGQFLSKRPSIYAQSAFWTSSPTWFAIRVGIVMTAVAVSVRRVGTRARTGSSGRSRVAIARAIRAEFAVRLLDSRRARVRLRDLAAARSPAAVGNAHRLCGVQPADVPRGYFPRSHRGKLALRGRAPRSGSDCDGLITLWSNDLAPRRQESSIAVQT